jgi:phage-related minor tail protein
MKSLRHHQMEQCIMADDNFDSNGFNADTLDQLQLKTRDLEQGANNFASAMSRAFATSLVGGKQFDDVLKSLALRLSDLSLRIAFRPLERTLASGLESLFSGLSGLGGNVSLTAASGAVKPFATGGVIGSPTYFPLAQGGIGLAGEAGPEAIMPLARGADGRLGVRNDGGSGGARVVINISTPDTDSFRRSESYVAGQIARAVARGQRAL